MRIFQMLKSLYKYTSFHKINHRLGKLIQIPLDKSSNSELVSNRCQFKSIDRFTRK